MFESITIHCRENEWGAILLDPLATAGPSRISLAVCSLDGVRLRNLSVVLESEMRRPGSRWVLYFSPIANSRNRILKINLSSGSGVSIFDDHESPYSIVERSSSGTESNNESCGEEDLCCLHSYAGRIDRKDNPYANARKADGGVKASGEILENTGLFNPHVVPILGPARLCLLLPSLEAKNFTGKTNTALIMASLLAKRGVRVSVISTHTRKEEDDLIRRHIANLVSDGSMLGNIEFVDGHGSNHSFFGEDDVIMATAWRTAARAQEVLSETNRSRFIYLIQDYEPLLYPRSVRSTMAQETYSYDYIPVINGTTLADYLFKTGPGKFGDKCFRSQALIFQPAADRRYFHPDSSTATCSAKKTLLFYARASDPQSMFGMGLQAVTRLIHRGVINAAEWRIQLMGEDIAPIEMGGGFIVESPPWMGYEDYSRYMRNSTVGLSLMLSPNPGYPSLEMAACGLPVVTTPYETKTADALKAISQNIIPVNADEKSIADGLESAIEKSRGLGSRIQNPLRETKLPESWESALNSIVSRVLNIINDKRGGYRREGAASSLLTNESYAAWKKKHLLDADDRCHLETEPCLLSIVTSAYNVPPKFINELAKCILQKSGYSKYEWVLLDNGSTEHETIQAINQWSGNKRVRHFRVNENLGIVGGMRFLLEHAQGRYIFPTDSDDYLAANSLRIMAWHIKKNNFPPLLYSDEDLLTRDLFLPGYLKPEWDPVLLLNSCYIAHWCAIDRKLALDLEVYSDKRAEGCHDWDTFIRFMKAGYRPVHVPVCLYSWRIHSASAAGGNIQCKPYIQDSHIRTLSSYLNSAPGGDRYSVVHSPLFNKTPDWYFLRKRVDARPLLSILIRGALSKRSGKQYVEELAYPRHEAVSLDIRASINSIYPLILQYAKNGGMIHFMYDGVQADAQDWPWEAVSLFELHKDAVMIGGRIYSKEGQIVAAGEYFGFGGDCNSPDIGRSKTHPGYQVQMWKQRSVSSVPTMFCVVDAAFLLKFLTGGVSRTIGIPNMGAWLGAYARRHGMRVVYSPFLSGMSDTNWGGLVRESERAEFATLNQDIIRDEFLLHPEHSLIASAPYKYVHKARRDEFLDCWFNKDVSGI